MEVADNTGVSRFRVVMLACLLALNGGALAQEGQSVTFAQFEAGLQQYPTGYVMYAKLNDKDKQAVYAEFLKAEETKRYSAAIKKTIELSIQ